MAISYSVMKNAYKSILRITYQLSYVLDNKQKKTSIYVLLSMLVLSCLELISVSAIYPFLQMLTSDKENFDYWYTRGIYYIFPGIEKKNVILIMSMLIIMLFIIKNATAIGCNYFQLHFATSFQRDCSTHMLRSYLKRPYLFFVNTNSSIILRGISSDTSSVYIILVCLFQMCSEIITIIMIGAFLLYTEWFIAICALGLAAICFVIIVLGFKEQMKKAGIKYGEAYAKQSKYCFQAINGIKEISVLDRREIFVDQYKKASDEFAKTSLTKDFISSCPDRILEAVCVGGLIGIITLKIIMGVDIDTFVPVLGVFAMGAFKILPSISKISSRVNNIIYYQEGLNRCYENMKEAEKSDNNEISNDKYILDVLSDETEISFKKEIVISNISWTYTNNSKPIIHNLSLSIKKGESVAFIGPSGAGKTTLADIIMGLLPPQEGSITMDEIDIFKTPHQWHKIIGYVPQTVFLIDDTVRANVAFGLPYNMVSDEKVWSALKQAQISDFIENLPDGLDTIVGERGIKFSGGQRQRVALARALYDNPSILILDEATSALDTETEKAVMESIELLQGQKTLIIVAHRLSTIKNCNRIYEIKDGIAFEKKYQELI